MRVHDSNLNVVTIGTRQTNRTDGETACSRDYDSRSYSDSDCVSLSNLSSAVRDAGEDPARTEWVSNLAAAYRSGTYTFDAVAVAKGVVNDGLKVN
jgi:anti-sigma28 factor (negative regulator of flagellin synthesis)